jgi:hypothetical protein
MYSDKVVADLLEFLEKDGLGDADNVVVLYRVLQVLLERLDDPRASDVYRVLVWMLRERISEGWLLGTYLEYLVGKHE